MGHANELAATGHERRGSVCQTSVCQTKDSEPPALKIDLFEQLERHASTRPGDVALRTISDSSTRSITFRELIDRSRALSRLIADAGVQPGCRVGLLLPNDHQFGVAFLAAASAGAVIVPLDPSQDAARFSATIAHAECGLLLVRRMGTSRTDLHHP